MVLEPIPKTRTDSAYFCAWRMAASANAASTPVEACALLVKMATITEPRHSTAKIATERSVAWFPVPDASQMEPRNVADDTGIIEISPMRVAGHVRRDG